MVDASRRTAAIKFCKALSIACGNKPLVWRSPALAARIRMRLGAETDQVIAFAKEQGWLDLNDERDVCLTIKGVHDSPASSQPRGHRY